MLSPPPQSSTSPITDGAADAIDENLLLAETEELLAALDATAFIASPMSTEDDEDDDGDSSSAASVTPHVKLETLPPTDERSDSSASTTTTIAPAVTGKKRVRSRDRTKDELVALRRTVVDLEQHLVALRRSTMFMGKGKRNVTQTWGHIAKRQQHDRARAEAENQHLKALLLGQLSLAGRFDHSSNKRQLVALPDVPATTTLKQRMPNGSSTQDALSNAAAMDALIDALDGHYAEMSGVFRANNIHDWPLAPQTYAQTKTRDGLSDKSYLELVEVRLIPFPVAAVGTYLWQSMQRWHRQSSSFAYPCRDRPDDTFAVGYCAQSQVNNGGRAYSASFKLVKRRYVRSDNEVVVVWKSRSVGTDDLAGLESTEVGWVVVTHVPAVDEHAPPTTALRACVQIFTDGEAVSTAATETPPDSHELLRSLVVDSFEEDVNSINQHMENLLLSDALAHNSAAEGVEGTKQPTTTGRIRFAAVE